MLTALMFMPCLAADGDTGASPGTAGTPETPKPTREELVALFGPEKEVEDDLIEAEILDANVTRAIEDAWFLSVSKDLRGAYDRSQDKATRTQEDKVKGNAFRMVIMSGPEFAESLVYYIPPKKKAAAGVAAIPPWQTYVAREALAEVYPLLMAAIDKRLTGEGRVQTEKESLGLPPSVTDHYSFMAQSERFQINYTVSDEVWKHKDAKGVEKETKVSIGWRNDQFRPEPKVKAATAPKPPSDGQKAPEATAPAPA